jgi:hypothetical protein
MNDAKQALRDLTQDIARGFVPPPSVAYASRTESFEVSSSDVDRIVTRRLHQLQEGFWVNMDCAKPGWYITIDMRGRGSDIDEYVAPYDDPRFALPRAAYELRKALEQRAAKGKP